jgi:membrane associated rhomboid family serine protease
MSRYYRGSGGRPTYTLIGGGGFTPAVKALVIANVAVFVLQILDDVAGGTGFFSSFGLLPAAVIQRFFVWQLVTYLFLHGGVLHIALNMFILWMFGCELERTWGARGFLRYYFVCGVGAGILTVLADPGSTIPTIGASGAIYGLLLAYGMLFPTRIIYLYMIIPMQAKYFVLLIGTVTFLSSFSSGGGGGIAHIAHLGGMIFGYLYLRTFGGGRRSPRPGWRDYYEKWRRERLRRKFEAYYDRRQAERDRDPGDPRDR